MNFTNLKELREKNNKSIEQVARNLNISKLKYVSYEKGKKRFDIKLVLPLAEYFSVSPDLAFFAAMNSDKTVNPIDFLSVLMLSEEFNLSIEDTLKQFCFS